MSTPTTAHPPVLLATLTEGECACRACGAACPDTPERPAPVAFTVLSREGQPTLLATTGQPSRTVDLTLCATCSGRHEAAAALAAAYPRLAARYGSVLPHQIACGLDGLAALGVPALRDPSTTGAEVVALLEHLVVPGSYARFSARFSPVALREARPTECSARPFSHLTPERREALLTARAAYLKERVTASAPPQQVPCPSGGCAYCGLAAVAVAALVALRDGTGWLWTPRAGGHLCPACERAVASVGSTGPSAMERALRLHLGLKQQTPYPQPVEGLRPWSETGRPPSQVAWAFVDLSPDH